MAGATSQYGYVDPYRGHYLGAIEKGGFFDIVLTLHRTLFLGTTGRIVVELTTCWTIVLVATGIYLWWPHKANQVWGVWLPRLRRKPYVVLRDLHTVSGIYLAVVAIVISLTGLIYTYAWGAGFKYAAQKTEAYDLFSKPMLSKSPPEAKDLPIDRIIEIAQEKMPGKTLTVWFPRVPNGVYLALGSNDCGPRSTRCCSSTAPPARSWRTATSVRSSRCTGWGRGTIRCTSARSWDCRARSFGWWPASSS